MKIPIRKTSEPKGKKVCVVCGTKWITGVRLPLGHKFICPLCGHKAAQSLEKIESRHTRNYLKDFFNKAIN